MSYLTTPAIVNMGYNINLNCCFYKHKAMQVDLMIVEKKAQRKIF
ncbi:MAG TPA: hypothetical protein PLM71_09145 [Syntrophorhabdaceae bacterium]|nr:hypothetical protein [Syntrophorhabdaceae bacterium]HPU30474.1 hypothetical protein [Syntrophorhabdaceae bacterium]